MKAQHTQGEWFYDTTRKFFHNNVVRVNGTVICSIISTSPEDEANARLIENAPELLEALKNALARMDENPPKKGNKRDLDAIYRYATFCRDREDARRAIAKATGG